MNIGSRYDEDCIICDHKLDIHKIETYSFTEEGKLHVGYRIKCHNDDRLEGGYYHCICNAEFKEVNFNINITKMENNKK
jgi:hypothetical protein